MESSTKSNSIDCFDVVGIIFIVLKILAIEPVAHWSWLWVLCPFWVPLVLVIIFSFLRKFYKNIFYVNS